MDTDLLRAAWATGPEPGPHPPEEALLAYLEEAPDPALEAHLARCGACLRALVELRAITSRPAPAPGWRWAAAAALMLSLSIWWALPRGTSHPQPSAARIPDPAAAKPPATGAVPGTLWKADADAEAVLGEGVLVSLRQGSRLRIGRNPLDLALEEGAVLIESPGETVTLTLGGLKVEMAEGALAAEMPARSLAWILRSAEASEARLTVLRGRARLATGRVLEAGQSLGGSVSWRGASWSSLALGSSAIRDEARILLPEPPPSYVFEALVRKRHAGSEVTLLFPAAGTTWKAPVGENLLPAGEGWRRVRIEVKDGWCRVSAGMRDLVSRPAGKLDREVSPADLQGLGLRAWGGKLELKEARWRPLP